LTEAAFVVLFVIFTFKDCDYGSSSGVVIVERRDNTIPSFQIALAMEKEHLLHYGN
jgi:hypothetical protein